MILNTFEIFKDKSLFSTEFGFAEGLEDYSIPSKLALSFLGVILDFISHLLFIIFSLPSIYLFLLYVFFDPEDYTLLGLLTSCLLLIQLSILFAVVFNVAMILSIPTRMISTMASCVTASMQCLGLFSPEENHQKNTGNKESEIPSDNSMLDFIFIRDLLVGK